MITLFPFTTFQQMIYEKKLKSLVGDEVLYNMLLATLKPPIKNMDAVWKFGAKPLLYALIGYHFPFGEVKFVLYFYIPIP